MKSGFQFFVYILLCSDGSYYIGVTNDIERRIMEHNEGVDSSSFTYPRRPIELKFLEYYDDVIKAIEREKQLKGWSRKKKEALIEQNIPALKDLSKKFGVILLLPFLALTYRNVVVRLSSPAYEIL